jgi:hypothetical protein
MPADPFRQLHDTVTGLMSELPGAGDRLLAASFRRSFAAENPLPDFLHLRRVRLRWGCQLEKDGGAIRVLGMVWRWRSARERLNAEILLELATLPGDLETLTAVSASAELRLPRQIVPRPDGNLFFDLGGGEALEVLGTAASRPDHLAGLWHRGAAATILDSGEKKPWPGAALVALLRAMAEAGAPGPGRKLGALDPAEPSAWGWIHAFVAELAGLEPALAAAARGPLPRWLEPLRSRWGLARGAARLGVLVDEDGKPAGDAVKDTFLAPFEIQADATDDGLRLRVDLGLPDFLLADPVRGALLAEFEAKTDWKEVARELGRNLSATVTPTDVRNWLSRPDRIWTLRCDRRKDDDEYLLVMAGEAAGRECLVMLHADEGTLELAGEDRVRARFHVSVELIQAAPSDQVQLAWKTQLGGGKQLFCDLLHGYLRWHRLVQAAPPAAP